jgi:hypothetical protein
MNQYVITYLGGDQPSSPEQGKKHFGDYQKWLASLGDSAVRPMVPYKNSHTIAPDRSVVAGSSVAMTGHTVLQAESIEQAIELAKSCPFLDTNGSLEVAEMVQMPG